jgi:lactate dehydrogenase-like 2-hydroxyacid dehydrogenase
VLTGDSDGLRCLGKEKQGRTKMTRKIVITHWIEPEIMEYLSHSFLVIPNTRRSALTREEILERVRDAHGIMVSMTDPIDAAFLDRCPRLRIVAGVFEGRENVDVEACTDHKVWFTNLRGQGSSLVDETARGGRAAVLEAAANIFEALLGRRPRGAVNRLTDTRRTSAVREETIPSRP